MNLLGPEEEKRIEEKNNYKLFKLKKQNEAIKDTIIRDIRNPFEVQKKIFTSY